MRNAFFQKHFSYNNLLITGNLQQNYENMRNENVFSFLEGEQ